MKLRKKKEITIMREYLDAQRKITQWYNFKEYLKDNFLASASLCVAIAALIISIIALVK